MTHVCCPRCQLRFTGEGTASLAACPRCGEPPSKLDRAAQAMGMQLHAPDQHLPDGLMRAVAAAKRDPHKPPPATPIA